MITLKNTLMVAAAAATLWFAQSAEQAAHAQEHVPKLPSELRLRVPLQHGNRNLVHYSFFSSLLLYSV